MNMNRTSYTIAVIFTILAHELLNAQLIKLAETDTIFKAPESVAWDSMRGCLYVSNYTAPLKEGSFYGRHSVSKVDLEGKMIEYNWITGLSCPTGICIAGNKLFIVERFGVVEYDLMNDRISNKYYIKTTDFLNDITVDNNGNLYVTVSGTAKVYKINDGKVELWLEDERIKDPNGILYDRGRLLIGVNSVGYLKTIDLYTREITDLAQMGEGIIDGIKKCGDGYLVSHFNGNLYYISPSGEVKELLNTRSEGIFQADFEYIPSKHLLIIPALWNNKLLFYSIPAQE
jgi:sugar lactone lactonase YvrE